MSDTPYQQTIAFLIVALFVTFTTGFVIGRGEHDPSQVPSNFDTAGALVDARNARGEAKAYLELLTRQTASISELREVCAKQQQVAH